MTAPHSQNVAVDINVPYSDSWWLKRLFDQLREQQRRCDALQRRYEGDSPMPFVSNIQRDVVRWFVEKSRTNWERLIVTAVLSRLKIVGIKTAVDSDKGDDDAFVTWKGSRGKLWSLDAHKMALTMSMSYVIVGKDADRNLLVTAEDPRLVTAITDPANPYKVLAALKLYYDDVAQADVAYLYLPGRVMVAKHPRKRRPGSNDVRFTPSAYYWDLDILNNLGELEYEGMSGPIPWLAEDDGNGGVTGPVPVVPLVNEDAMAEFEPFLPHIDRMNQQLLQRMTIATIQAFKQRGFKGLPRKDPDTGEEIDYSAIFIADPGAVWHLPQTAEIWESGAVDLTPITNAAKADAQDLAAVSGTPLYMISPDAANGSAEGASLQREQITFKVIARQDRFEISHELVAELIFKTLGDPERSKPGTVHVMWAPALQLSMSERANAIAQTKGVMSRFAQLTEIWGYSPDEAEIVLSQLTDDFILDEQYAKALQAVNGATAAA